MSLSLSCSCGARFEVEDTFAGQAVACPECQRSLNAPSLARSPLRTSGLALASVILALVGAFTFLFTLLAVLLGVCALIHIGRNRERIAGSGYAVFGIIAGVAFTGLSFFMYTNLELLPMDGFFESRFLSGQVDYSGELEVSRPNEHFAITRPSTKWGVAKASLLQQMEIDGDLLLVNAHKQMFVEISTIELGGANPEQYVDQIIRSYQEDNRPPQFGWEKRVSGFKLRHRQTNRPADDLRMTELLLDVRVEGEDRTCVDRLLVSGASGRTFRVVGWTPRRRFVQLEAELRRALDSFRVLP
jgi:hypothetical protein